MGLTQEMLWNNSDKAEMIAVLDMHRISATCFIAPAVEEFNHNASKTVFGVILQSTGGCQMFWTTCPFPEPPLCCRDKATHSVPSQLVTMQQEVVGWPWSLEEWMVYPWLGWLNGCGIHSVKQRDAMVFMCPTQLCDSYEVVSSQMVFLLMPE